MKVRLWIAVIGLTFGISALAWAEGPIVKREENQQDRIAQGIQSGELTAGETAKLEKGEQKIESSREKAWSDGTLTAKEKARLEHMENKESHRIYQLKHNDKEAPSGPGPIVSRERHQQKRIAQGITSGQLTAGEAAKLERGEQKIEKNREKAWSDGSLSHQEKVGLERQENKESRQIFKAKHNRRR